MSNAPQPGTWQRNMMSAALMATTKPFWNLDAIHNGGGEHQLFYAPDLRKKPSSEGVIETGFHIAIQGTMLVGGYYAEAYQNLGDAVFTPAWSIGFDTHDDALRAARLLMGRYYDERLREEIKVF